MAHAPAWQSFFAEHFPAYLLPESQRHALSRSAAERFLEQIGEAPQALEILLAQSFFSAHIDALETLVHHEIPRLIRTLPSFARPETRSFEGKLPSTLDVPATLRRRLAGEPTHFIARSRKRAIDPPEDILLKALVLRLLELFALLRRRKVRFAEALRERTAKLELALSRILSSSRIGRIADAPITRAHEDAARLGRSQAHRLAYLLYTTLCASFDHESPEAMARLLAEGALTPSEEHVRFELSVLIRLMMALEDKSGLRLERSLIVRDRSEVAVFHGRQGAQIALYYNQTRFPPGPRDRGVRHYLGQKGRLRPDITLLARPLAAPPRATVIEAKLSDDPAYLAQGYGEAMLYCNEYGEALSTWPKAILVTSASLPGAPRREDPVIAVGWERWVPEEVIDALVEGMGY